MLDPRQDVLSLNIKRVEPQIGDTWDQATKQSVPQLLPGASVSQFSGHRNRTDSSLAASNARGAAPPVHVEPARPAYQRYGSVPRNTEAPGAGTGQITGTSPRSPGVQRAAVARGTPA